MRRNTQCYVLVEGEGKNSEWWRVFSQTNKQNNYISYCCRRCRLFRQNDIYCVCSLRILFGMLSILPREHHRDDFRAIFAELYLIRKIRLKKNYRLQSCPAPSHSRYIIIILVEPGWNETAARQRKSKQ